MQGSVSVQIARLKVVDAALAAPNLQFIANPQVPRPRPSGLMTPTLGGGRSVGASPSRILHRSKSSDEI
jgi:hypothetical protein